jgi:glutathione S-transferase
MWRVSDTTATVRYGPADVVSFSEFATKLQTNHELRTWMRPVVVQLECLRRAARKANVDSSGHRSSGKRAVKRTSSSIAPKLVGARPYFIQSSLLDLVEFLDPEPYKTVRPDYRKRLMLGQEHHAHQSRLPPSLFALYQELAKIRDREVSRDDHLRPFRGKPMEVFVKLDCPYSQRVLISLNLLCVTHRAIPINSDNLPSWYYLLSGGSRVPLVFCNGSLITGAKHIVGFLADKYPKKAKAALARSDIDRTSMSKLDVGVTRVGTMAYTRFFPAFTTAIRSDRAEDVDSLQKELRNLNTTVASLQRKRTKSAPFLGGMRFSREDTALAPMLNAVEVAGPALKGKDYGIPDDCISLKEYLKAARRMPCFMEAVPNDAVIVDGYRSLVTKRCDERSRPWFRDMLE